MQIQFNNSHISPLAAQSRNRQAILPVPAVRNTQADKAAELQAKRQGLQNEILLMRGTSSDSAELSAERLKNLEAELEEITAELRAPETPSVTELAADARASRRPMDWYEPEKPDTSSAGIYRLERDKENGYSISYAPYSEE